MDVFPTFLRAAGGDLAQYELDGNDILPLLSGDTVSEELHSTGERTIYWEMGDQSALRRGPWKLVLNGRLVERTQPTDIVHLANLEEDMGERVNLVEQYPEIAAELQAAALAWRSQIEARWQNEWQVVVIMPSQDGIGCATSRCLSA
jgi:arylsulfatase A-like enzyme